MSPEIEDEARLDALWRAHAPAVVRYARRRVLPAEVDEVVAETFLVAWRRLDEVPPVPLPWLLGVARGVSANVCRSARRRDALTTRLGRQPPVLPPLTTDLPTPLELALQSLRPDDRELLTLLAWDGLSREEAATALGVSRGTFAVRLHRVRRRVRHLLDGDGEPAPAPPPVAALPARTTARPPASQPTASADTALERTTTP